MNDLEFREQYKRLQEVHPHQFSPAEKFNSTWDSVKDMDIDWFERLVTRLVMANDIRHERYDIRESAIGERRARQSTKFAEEVCEATKAWGEVTEKGLDNVLSKYGSTSLLDAITKSRKGLLR